MTSGEHTKGHTELPWMAASAYSSVCGVPIVNQQGRRIANTALPDMPKEWDELKQQAVIDAAFIVTAVNTYPAVEGLVEALEAIERGGVAVLLDAALSDAPEGFDECPINPNVLQKIVDDSRSALTRFRELSGGAE